MSDPKRRHHYVWKYYLEAWSDKGLVACMRNGDIFETGANNLAVRSDFYEIQEMSSSDLLFIRRAMDKFTLPLQVANIEWLPLFVLPIQLKELAANLESLSPEIARRLSVLTSNTEEDLHAAIERRSIGHLDSLRKGDLQFLGSYDEARHFLHFLCIQYFRTAKLRDQVAAIIDRTPEVRPDSVWGPLRHMFATNVWVWMVGRWDQTEVTVLTAPPESEFITTDQPVINTRAVGIELGQPVETVELYYPIAPHLAMRWDPAHGSNSIESVHLTQDEVSELNRKLLSMAHEQVYATNRRLLRALA